MITPSPYEITILAFCGRRWQTKDEIRAQGPSVEFEEQVGTVVDRLLEDRCLIARGITGNEILYATTETGHQLLREHKERPSQGKLVA